jgi:kynurenine formamidase
MFYQYQKRLLMFFPFTCIDLTHTLSPNIPTWDLPCGFQCTTSLDYIDCTSDVKFRVQQINTPAGIGTHMDAPSHCIPGGAHSNELPLEQFIAPCVVIDISSRADENYVVSAEDIVAFEKTYGIIASGSFVIIKTGWDRFWHKPARYHNNLLFPSVSPAAAQILLDRTIVGLGIDTLSPDVASSGFPVHQLLLGAGKYIVENVAHADLMPPVGSFIVALPLKIENGTEAPMRLIGLIKKKA